MCAVQLQKNPRLDSFFVRDLNREPEGWVAADASFDAVVCCVSVQYLQQPEKVEVKTLGVEMFHLVLSASLIDSPGNATAIPSEWHLPV